MSMVMTLVELSDADIDRLLANPISIWKVVSPDDLEFMTAEPEQKTSFFGKMFGKKAASPPPEVSTFDPVLLEDMYLDKSWDILHHLLAGRVWEEDKVECFLVVGSEYVGEVDVGYGPARVLKSELVRRVAAYLEPITPQEVRSRFDPTDPDLGEVYPTIWDRPEEQAEILEWIESMFGDLKVFVTSVAERGNGVAISLG